MLIAEGSDWNWWYGPEHHSANDREFDELYRKHLSNVYQALGARRRTIWRSPFSAAPMRPEVVPQTAYIHPRITGDMVRYFEWMGAAVYTADRRAGAMHGKAIPARRGACRNRRHLPLRPLRLCREHSSGHGFRFGSQP